MEPEKHRNFFQEHPAVLGTMLYVLLNAVGVIYAWALFRQFEINVFDYIETNDFLLAAFREPTTLALGALAAVLAVAGFAIYQKVMLSLFRDRTRGEEMSGIEAWLRKNLWLFFVLVALAALSWATYVAARDNAEEIRVGNRFNLRVYLNPSRTGHAPLPVFDSSALIGTTETLLFLIDRTEREEARPADVIAVPRASIHHIEFPPFDQGPALGVREPAAVIGEVIGATGGEFAATAYFAAGGTKILNEGALRKELAALRTRLLAERRPLDKCDARLLAAADRTGAVERNFGLASDRAAAFLALLTEALPVEPLVIVGGEMALAVHTPDGTPEALNRRAVLELRCDAR